MKRNETLGPTVVRTTVNTICSWHWRPVAYDQHIFQRSLAAPKQLRAPARGSGRQAGDTIRLECWSSLSAGHDV